MVDLGIQFGRVKQICSYKRSSKMHEIEKSFLERFTFIIWNKINRVQRSFEDTPKKCSVPPTSSVWNFLEDKNN